MDDTPEFGNGVNGVTESNGYVLAFDAFLTNRNGICFKLNFLCNSTRTVKDFNGFIRNIYLRTLDKHASI